VKKFRQGFPDVSNFTLQMQKFSKSPKINTGKDKHVSRDSKFGSAQALQIAQHE